MIAKHLDIWFEHLSTQLGQILVVMENRIPLASRVSNTCVKVSERLHQERLQLINKISHQGLWNKLVDLASFSEQQLNRDLALTSESIKNLKSICVKRERIYTELLAYQIHVSHLKVCSIPFFTFLFIFE